MNLSAKAQAIVSEYSHEKTKFGDLKKKAKEIKKDHNLAMELWSTGGYYPRLLAILIMDKKLLTQEIINQLASDMLTHEQDQRNQLADWFLANQLMKDKKTISLLNSWNKDSSPILRRLFWYYQARLRWTGQKPPENSGQLLDLLESHLAEEKPDVQWAMNFCAGQIGIHESKFRARCIKLGEKSGLYKDEVVARNCTPSYLPEFISIEVAKGKYEI
jgi:3-methyladenine DNA glycosylase AlkD